MNFYEADLIQKQQELREFDEKPGMRLKSRRIWLELKIKRRREQLEALRQGKPMLEMQNFISRLCGAMGFTNQETSSAAMQRTGLPGALHPSELKERARALGLAVDTTCDHCYLVVGAVEAGAIPVEDIMICNNYLCPQRVLQKLFIFHHWPNNVIFHFDRPPEESEANLEYLVNQFREFIEFAEWKFPGVIKYDEEKLVELQARDEAAAKLNYEIYEMLKHQPSPIAGHDVLTHTDIDTRNPEYVRARRDEIAERIEKGIAAVPGEKLRVLWDASFIKFFDAPKVLEKWGAAVIFWYAGVVSIDHTAPIPRPAYYGGRQLTPLEEEAAWALQHEYGGTGARYIDNLIKICRDLKIDAIISFDTLGAACYRGLKGMIVERAEKELGIPTLRLEGKRWDPSYVDEATMTAKLDEFAQILLSR